METIVHHEQISTYSDLITRASIPCGKHENDRLRELRNYSSIQDKGDPAWDQGADYSESLHMLKSGWHDYGQKLALDVASMNLPDELNTINIIHDYEGDHVDIERFLEHDPECWINPILHESTGKNITLYVNPGIRVGLDSQYVYNRGLAVLAMVEFLERNNINTTIISLKISGGYQGNDQLLLIETPIKLAHEYINYDKLAFIFAHATYNRRIMFRIMEQLPHDVQKIFGVGEIYGRTGSHLPDAVKPLLVPNSIYIGGIIEETGIETKEHALKTITKLITNGVNI